MRSRMYFTLGFCLLVNGFMGAAEPIAERAELLRQAERYRPNLADFRWQAIPWFTDAETAWNQARTEKRPMLVWLAGGRDRDGTPLERC